MGITRARQRLYLSRAVARSAWGAASYNLASRFLEEVPIEVVRWERTEAAYTSWSGDRAGVGARGEARTVSRNLSFVGGTPKATELASRLGIDASKLTTASELARAEAPSLAVGDRVNHQRWGMGRVQAIEGTKAQIDFGDQVMWIVLRNDPIEKL